MHYDPSERAGVGRYTNGKQALKPLASTASSSYICVSVIYAKGACFCWRQASGIRFTSHRTPSWILVVGKHSDQKLTQVKRVRGWLLAALLTFFSG